MKSPSAYIDYIIQFFRSFSRTISTPFGRNLTITGKELLIAVFLIAVCLVLLALICSFRHSRKKRAVNRADIDSYTEQVTAYDDEETVTRPDIDDEEAAECHLPPASDDTENYDCNPTDDTDQQSKEKNIVYADPILRPPKPEPEIPVIVLIGIGGYFDHKRITQKGDIVIGRHPQRCTVVYPANERGISAVHCRIQTQDGLILLTDLGSQCGTFVNGEQLKPNVPFHLQTGDTFWLADHTNSFFLQ